MSEAAAETNGPDARAQALVASYERAGYRRAEPAILQPAEPFLDLSGEDIRRRMYLTSEPSGRELCLRPDLTIPVSRDYLASPAGGEPAGFCYLGPVFRQRGDKPGEFLQAGIESFARRATAAADAEMLALGLEALAQYGVVAPEIRIGDIGLFTALIEALDLPAAWRRRLSKDFHRAGSLAHDLDRLRLDAAQSGPDYRGLLAALAGSDLRAAHALVTDLLSIAGITTVGGRSVGEIADRFLEQAALGAAARLPQQTQAVIERFLKITGDPDEAAADLRALAEETGVALGSAIDLLESRTGFFAAQGIDVSRMHFATAFGRGVDYSPAFVFQIHAQRRLPVQLGGGGPYGARLSRLGAMNPIPGVGFAVWSDRLQAIGSRP